MIYHSEIDGLRALAVLPVILFHAGFELFSGGFVGVDVFTILCNDQDICSPFNEDKQMCTNIIHPSKYYSDVIAKEILRHLSQKNISI